MAVGCCKSHDRGIPTEHYGLALNSHISGMDSGSTFISLMPSISDTSTSGE